MKKTLAILLMVCLMFTTVFPAYAEGNGVSTNSADQTPTTNVVFSDFYDFSDTSVWDGKRIEGIKDEDNDGVKDYIRLNTTADKKTAYIVSKTTTLVPGTEYELSFYVRIPSTSANYIDGSTKFAPRFIIYQTGAEANGKATDSYIQGTNEYAYKNVRRTDFVSTWQIGDLDPIIRKRYSLLSEDAFFDPNPDANPNEVYKDWKKVTTTFTAIDDNNVGPQMVSFRIDLRKDLIANAQLDIKNLTLIDKSIVIPESETQKTVLYSDFDGDTNWLSNTTKNGDPVEYLVDTDGANFARISSLEKNAGIKSTPFALVPNKEYELSYYIRVPEGTPSYQLGEKYSNAYFAPNLVMFEATTSDDGKQITNTYRETDSQNSNNFYAYNQKANADEGIEAWARRSSFEAVFNIGDYGEISRKNSSSLGYLHLSSLLKDQFADINAAFKDWTKVTARFTAVAEQEGETEQVTGLVFYFSASITGLKFDLKDVKVIENPDAAPETPEEPEEPTEPEEPIIPAEPIDANVSVVDVNGTPFASASDLGIKTTITNNEDSTKTFNVNYDDMDGVVIFKGWFDGDTFLSADANFTASAEVNTDNVKAKLICRSVIDGGLGFENYTEDTTLRVSEEDANGNLHNVAPFDDKWGQMYKSYQQTDDYCMPITTNYGSKNVKYVADVNVETVKITYDYVSVNPYSGNSMFNFSTPGRAVVRKLDNLKPNTNYELSFYVYNTSEYEFLHSAVIGNKYTISRNATYSGTIDEENGKDNYDVVYAAYVAKTTKIQVNGKDYKVLADKNKVRNWNKIIVQFTTDEDDTSLYLKLASSTITGNQTAVNNIFIDNLTCAETVVGYAGNAMRSKDEGKPQALRYKFAVANEMLNNFEGMSFKKIGILAVKSEVCGADVLEIGKKYTFNGKEYTVSDATVNPETNFQYVEGDTQNTYFTAALYNIGGKKDGKVDYNTYDDNYAVRPYIIYEDEKGVEAIVYGGVFEVSVFDVMYAVLKDGRNKSDVSAVKSMFNNQAISDGYFNWQPTDSWYYGEEELNDYAYSFAIIGDTQKTTHYFPEDLHYIYDWILDNADDKNIQFVMGMGDITDIKEGSEAEWELSAEQLARLEQAGIKQSIVRGNHDDEDWFDEYISVDKFGSNIGDINESTYDGTLKNYYQLIEINNIKYMIVTLDFQPDANEIAWAKQVIDAHPEYNVILTTHSYFDHDLSLNSVGVNINDAIVSKCSNVVLVLCGHRYPQDEDGDYGPRYSTTTRDDGSKVVQMMVNPQAYESTRNESTGMIAMLYFSEDGKSVQLKYFSARSEMYYKDNFQFDFELDLVD